MARQGKALNRRLKRRAKAAQQFEAQAVEREAKQIVKSDGGARTISAETQADRHRGKDVQIVPGGLPGQGKS
jgi:hypothetical protein